MSAFNPQTHWNKMVRQGALLHEAALDARSERRYTGEDDREREERDRYDALGAPVSGEDVP